MGLGVAAFLGLRYWLPVHDHAAVSLPDAIALAQHQREAIQREFRRARSPSSADER